MTQTGFKFAIPSSEPSQTHMLHRAATEITKIRITNSLRGRTYCVIEGIFQSFFWGVGGGLGRNTKNLAITRAQTHHEYNSRVSNYNNLPGRRWY